MTAWTGDSVTAAGRNGDLYMADGERSSGYREYARQCPGQPEGYPCPVIIQGRVWCRSCTERRQALLARSLPTVMVPVGIILEDFESPHLLCRCGGSPTADQHRFSLQHIEWAWKQNRMRGVPGDRRKFAAR